MNRPSAMSDRHAPGRIMFLYLGRRGALCQFTLQLAMAASRFEEIRSTFVISHANTLAPRFLAQGEE